MKIKEAEALPNQPFSYQPSVLADLYKQELLNQVIPFWMENSLDKEAGGFFTCLNRDGRVYDTDKFTWLQARQVWTFSTLYNSVKSDPAWLDTAVHGARFLEKYGRDNAGNWYFSLTREGKPLTQPYNIFSDCFAVMGFAALHKATAQEKYKTIALDGFENILQRQHNWKGIFNKSYPGTRPLRNFSLPMILSNLSLEMEDILGKDRVDKFLPPIVEEILHFFYRPEWGVVLENLSPDGSFVDSFEGRVVNPGHGIEAMWFLMDIGNRLKDAALVRRAVDITLQTLEYGWDPEYGGIFYFLDVKSNPPQQLEWDQKLWWVHLETLVALAKGFQLTGDERCWNWFIKVHEWSWNRFRDPHYGEWFGYLNRRGEVLLPLKGGKWKGCFHVPRALLQVWKTFESI